MAVEDYSIALRLGQEATGGSLEPYVMNSRGNAYASRGLYSEALHDYDESVKVPFYGHCDHCGPQHLVSSSYGRLRSCDGMMGFGVQGFQSARELDGAIYAAGNAALTRIQVKTPGK